MSDITIFGKTNFRNEQKKFGIKTGMPLFKARELCPHILPIKGDFTKYLYIHKKTLEIFEKLELIEYRNDFTLVIKNYKQYQDVALTNAERQAKFREKRRESNEEVTGRNKTVTLEKSREEKNKENYVKEIAANAAEDINKKRKALRDQLRVAVLAVCLFVTSLLYPVKTSVNKSIRGALTVSEEAKTLWSATLAVRRLEEAGVLAIEGRLTDSTRADIKSRLDKHVEDFKMRTDLLAQAEDKTEAVADAQSYFETTLKAHTSVLAELSAVNPEAEQELRPILAVARAYADTVEKARTATERVITLKAGRNVQERAFAKKKEAENEYLTIRSRPSSAPTWCWAMAAGCCWPTSSRARAPPP